MNSLVIPDGFHYETTRDLDLEILMPTTIDFSDYHSRFWVYNKNPKDGGYPLASGSFKDGGIFQGRLVVSMTSDALFFRTFVLDTLVPLRTGVGGTRNLRLDFREIYDNQLDTIEYPLGKVNVIGKNHGVLAELLTNGNFDDNNFGVDPSWISFYPDTAKWYSWTDGIGNVTMTWLNPSPGETYMGTGPDMSRQAQYGLSQTVAVLPGDLLTFSTDVKAENSNGAHTHYQLTGRNAQGGITGHAMLRYSFPDYQWTSKTVALTMPPNTSYCTVSIVGGEWTNTGRILFDNLTVNGIIDQDGDGVEDALDDYPNDAERAYNYYYPSETTFGTFAFEDNWPSRGDYDFNDVVIDYRYKQVLNASNEMVDLEADFVFRASGAGYINGFGIQLDCPPGAIDSATGMSLEEGLISTLANGCESGQSKATIIVADNFFKVTPHGGNGIGVNTNPNHPRVSPVTLPIRINFGTPISISSAGYAPYNPFIIVNEERGKEVHLPGYPPTDLVNSAYFGTGEDDTDLAAGKYYLTNSNLPWGINLPTSFDYPVEGSEISSAYTHFGQWAQSRGFSFMDWYGSSQGYRDATHIFIY